MKKTLLIAFAISLVAFTSIKFDTQKAAATVNQLQGYYLFVDSRPVQEYTVLGTIKMNAIMTNPQYTNVRDKLIEKVKKEYPKAEGIIFSFNSGAADHADAIVFK